MSWQPPDPPTAYAIPPFADAPDLGCRDAEPEVFFPDGYKDDQADTAKWFCRRCPHRWDCLDFALTTEQRFGIWGGATPAERARMRPGAQPDRRTA